MSDMDWKKGVLIMVVAVGGLLEMFKHSSVQSVGKIIDKQAISLLNTFTKPYSVLREEFSNPAPKLPQVAIAQSHPIQSSDSQGFAYKGGLDEKDAGGEGDVTASGDGKKKKKKKGDKVAKQSEDDKTEWEYFQDPYTGKIWRRKKKVAKVEEKAEEKNETAENKPQETTEELSSSQVVAAAGAAGGGNQKIQNEDAALEDWIRQLLAQPNPDLTRIFIQKYQTGLVTPEVFYKVVKMMADDPREAMKKMGVMCAAATPSLQSFQILIGIQKGEHPGSTLYVQVDSSMGIYANIQYLSVLQKALLGTDNYVLVVATQKVDAAANRYLTAASPTKHTSQNPPAAATSVVSRNASRFQPFLTLLQSLSKSKDNTVSTQASSTLANLQHLLGTSAPSTPTQTAENDLDQQQLASDPSVAINPLTGL